VLAAEAGVAASTTSAHLAKLVAAHLLTVERRGRHRYFRLAGPDVATLLEAIARVAPSSPVRSLTEGMRAEALRRARTCYDHLAGRLGVALFDALLERGAIEAFAALTSVESGGEGASFGEPTYRLTECGREVFSAFGLETDSSQGRRPMIRACLDWSEQRPHLAGVLGAALAQRLFELRWISRVPRGRALRITEEGGRGLLDSFGIAAH